MGGKKKNKLRMGSFDTRDLQRRLQNDAFKSLNECKIIQKEIIFKQLSFDIILSVTQSLNKKLQQPQKRTPINKSGPLVV